MRTARSDCTVGTFEKSMNRFKATSNENAFILIAIRI